MKKWFIKQALDFIDEYWGYMPSKIKVWAWMTSRRVDPKE